MNGDIDFSDYDYYISERIKNGDYKMGAFVYVTKEMSQELNSVINGCLDGHGGFIIDESKPQINYNGQVYYKAEFHYIGK